MREILRLPDAEERWLRECWGPSQEAHNPVFGRLDALVDFTSPMWKESLRFVEPNLSGIGGLHMVPMCERLLADIVVPVLRDGDAGLDLIVGQDMRELLVQELLDHVAAIGGGPAGLLRRAQVRRQRARRAGASWRATCATATA